ncbi:MAG: putative exported protein [Gammaproteobacteria bacterium]|jgi:hypothetical protein|nr:putative exported protein [Gammaproteobacteria bacterium]
MKKRVLALLILLLSITTAYADINAQQVVTTFGTALNDIKIQLQNGSMSPAQASVLLQVIQARQNNVMIQQNQEIINALSKASPSNKISS